MDVAAHWDAVFSQKEWGKYPSEELIRFVARNFYAAHDRSAVTLLEIGCGPGANLWYAAREGFTVMGVDASTVAIGQARDRLDTEVPGWRGQLTTADVRALPLDDATVDAIIDNECVCCLDITGARQAYVEAARVLKPRGKLYARMFADGCYEGPTRGSGSVRFTAIEDIPELLSGFDVTSIELLTISYENRQHTCREWIVQGTKK